MSLFNQADYLLACILHRSFRRVRTRALEVLSRCSGRELYAIGDFANVRHHFSERVGLGRAIPSQITSRRLSAWQLRSTGLDELFSSSHQGLCFEDLDEARAFVLEHGLQLDHTLKSIDWRAGTFSRPPSSYGTHILTSCHT